jgi:quercetin dioxygenase-like cupin family protein
MQEVVPMYQTRKHADVTPVEMLPGVFRRTLTEVPQLMLCEVTLEEGSVVPLHQHPHHQIGYVVSGRIGFQIGEERFEFGAGDSYAIAGGVLHSAWPVGGSCVIIDVFNPTRDEYRGSEPWPRST